MKRAIIRTLRRIADAMEGRGEFPPATKSFGVQTMRRSLERAMDYARADGELFCLHPTDPNAPIGDARWYSGPTRLCPQHGTPTSTTQVAGVTVKHPPSMADEVEKMRAEQERDIANVELPAVMRKRTSTNPHAKPARVSPIRKPRG